ncbi:hypothetical protein PM082_014954 [Marasmius tenuissimus]|nr:hypothetical protein PM082_014954 [Marasmius tenuissimus]
MIQTFRAGVFVIVSLLTLTVAGLCIYSVVVTIQELGGYFSFQITALVTAALTIIVCSSLGLISLISKSSAAIWNIVEIPKLVVLAILWLVTGIKTDQAIAITYEDGTKVDLSTFCRQYDDRFYFKIYQLVCNELSPMRYLAFTCFALLAFYCVFTLILCIVAKALDTSRTVWKISAYNAHYFGIPSSVFPSQQGVPSVGYMYGPNQQIQQGQQSPYVVYVPQPPPGMMMVPIQGQGQMQGPQSTAKPGLPVQSTTSASSTKVSESDYGYSGK